MDGFNIIPGVFQSKSQEGVIGQDNQIELMRRSLGNTQLYAEV